MKCEKQGGEEVPPDFYDRALRIPLYRRYHINRFRSMCKLIGDVSGLAMLDVGCDGGTFTEHMVKSCKPSFTAALDLDFKAISYAKAKRPIAEFLVADGLRLPFRDEAFELVTIMEVLEHVHEPKSMLKEAYRVLRKGGLLVALVPNEKSKLYRVVWPVWTKFRGRVWSDKHVVEFDEEVFKELVEDVGFKVVETCKPNFGMLIAIKAVKPS